MLKGIAQLWKRWPGLINNVTIQRMNIVWQDETDALNYTPAQKSTEWYGCEQESGVPFVKRQTQIGGRWKPLHRSAGLCECKAGNRQTFQVGSDTIMPKVGWPSPGYRSDYCTIEDCCQSLESGKLKNAVSAAIRSGTPSRRSVGAN